MALSVMAEHSVGHWFWAAATYMDGARAVAHKHSLSGVPVYHIIRETMHESTRSPRAALTRLFALLCSSSIYPIGFGHLGIIIIIRVIQ